jgi:hypothetical protein
VDLSGTSHVNYLVIETYKLAEQTGSYTPKPTREDYVGICFLVHIPFDYPQIFVKLERKEYF